MIEHLTLFLTSNKICIHQLHTCSISYCFNQISRAIRKFAVSATNLGATVLRKSYRIFAILSACWRPWFTSCRPAIYIVTAGRSNTFPTSIRLFLFTM